MQYTTTSDESCLDFAVKIIETAEAFSATVYPDNDNRATIGYGYTFNRNNNVKLFEEAGIELTDDQWVALGAIDAAPASQRTQLGLALGISITTTEGEALVKALMDSAITTEVTSVADELGMPSSIERAVVLSRQYNRGIGSMSKTYEFQTDVFNGDRAEAWFQLRYMMWGSKQDQKGGLLKRSFWEAQIFGLYDPGITNESVVDAYAMLQHERSMIFKTEVEYGIPPNGAAATLRPRGQNAIAMANSDPKLNAIRTVDTIVKAFDPAKRFFSAEIDQADPILNNLAVQTFAPSVNFMLASANSPTVDARQSYGFAPFASQNHVLIGQESGDKLIGAGSDLLVAGAGDEILYAGTGAATLVGGQALATSVFGAAGYDTLVGGHGVDEFDIIATSGLGAAEILTSGKDQKGSIKFVGPDGAVTTLGGDAESQLIPIHGHNNAWSADGTTTGIVYVYDPVTYQLSIGINGSPDPAGFQIDIVDFDLNQAVSSNGYLGIHLQAQTAFQQGAAVFGGGATRSSMVAARTAMSLAGSDGTFQGGGTQYYTFEIDSAVNYDRTIHVSLKGAQADDFGALVGATSISLRPDGTFDLLLLAGQTRAAFGLVDATKQNGNSDLAAGATLSLSAAIDNPDGQDSSQALLQSIQIQYLPEASDSGKLARNYTQINPGGGSDPNNYFGDGGNDLVLAAVADNNIQLGNSVNDSIVGGTGSNTVVGGSGNDVITLAGTSDHVTLGGGHSTVNGAAGNDFIRSYQGDAIVNGLNGTDVILLGSGMNEVYADSQTSLSNAIANSSAALASHKKGDLISVLDGDNTVVGGLGDDLIFAGSGRDIIVLGPGQDTFLGGSQTTDATSDWTTHIEDNTVVVDGASGPTQSIVNTYPQPYNGTSVVLGNDTLNSGGANDTVFGGTGNDLILLGNGNNYVEAGSGNTTVSGGMGDDTIIGGSGYDTLQGGGGNTYIEGGSGQAQIWGGDGNNTLIGGAGNATIHSSAIDSSLGNNGRWAGDTLSNNYVSTGSGDDLVYGSAGHDTLVAGVGNVTIQGGVGYEYIVGGSGNDVLVAGEGQDTLIAGSGDTTLQGSTGPSAVSWLYGGDGSDVIAGGSGENHLFAGNGGTASKFTTVIGGTDGSSTTTITGGLGVDFLQGGAGSTVINAGDGGTVGAATTIIGGTGETTITGGVGVDYIQGGSGTDVLLAGDGGADEGATTVVGMSGVATLSGGSGLAILVDSASGQDLLIAGAGQNTLVGMGADTFIAGTGSDTVQNNGGHVTVSLGSEVGALSAYNFQGGTTSLVVGGGVTAPNLAASVAFDGLGRSFLTLDMPTGAASIQGALTGSLADATFDSGNMSTDAFMTTAFQSDQIYQYGSQNLDLDVGSAESLSGAFGDTVSAWGADETIQGGGNGLIYSDGARALIQGGIANDTIIAAGDHDTVYAGSYGSIVTLAGANSVAVNQLGNGSLTASGAADTLVGGFGTTQFFVNDSTATVVSNNATGHDAVTATVNFTLPANVNQLMMSGTADIVGTGNAGSDVITGGEGHDTLIAGSGNATLIGGSASTTLVVNSIYDKVVENLTTNVDTIDSSVNFVLPTNVNVLALTGSGALAATANAGPDTLISNTGVDTLYGGTGGDLFIVNNAADVIIQANDAANDTLQTAYGLTLPSNVNNLVLTGSTNLVAQANDGNDTLVSNSGIDTLIGGIGNDTFVVNNSADVVQDASSTASNTIVASVDFTLPVHVNSLTLTGTAALQATGNSTADIIHANDGNDTLTAVSVAAATTLIGGAGNDVFVVNNTADVIRSGSTTSNDTIQSSADFTAVANVNTLVLTGTSNLKATANDTGDTLVSNSGIDTLVGGAGHDVFVVNNAADVLLNVSADDTVIYSVGLTLPAGVSNLILSGSSDVQVTTNGGDDQIVGNAGNDTITATTGQDTLIAGTGVDTLVGGTGNDLFVVNNLTDVVSVSGAHGQDTVQSSVDWTLGSGVNKLVLTGAADLAGNATSGNNELDGNAGNDTLYAGAGADTLVAGSAATTLVGGAGADTFVLHNAGDVVTNISATPGNAVVSYVSYTMQDNVTSLMLKGYDNLVATGNGAHDTIVGNAGDDTLIAGSGLADMYGGWGANLFVVNNVNDTVTDEWYGNKGAADTIQSSVAYTLPNSVDNLVLTGTADLVATANDHADSIVGNAGNDTLVAGQGDDTLISGTGVTVLQGGPGNDTFVVNNVNDVVTTNAADSDNVLMTSVSYTMPTNISELALIGSSDIQGTSNAGDVQMTAGDGNDTLVALGGQDTLIAGNGLATLVGGAGDDTFVVNNSADVVVDASTATNNAIFSSASFVLPAHVDSLTLVGSADISATGNTEANVLTAGYGNDTLIAGSGLATLSGGQGATTFVVDNILDVVQSASVGQANALQSSVSYVLPTNVDLMTLTGSANVTGTGNAAADTIIGNAGVDTLVSGSGNDLFVLGNGADVVSNAYTTNSDTIQSDYGFTLPANVNTLVLTGTAAVTGQANAGNDTLVSNSGADTLMGGAGNDTFVVNNSADVVQGVSASSNNSVVASVDFTLPTNVNTLALTGTNDLQATGNAAADLVRANAGNDTLVAVSTSAVTTLVGGTGNDVFVVNNTADVIQSASTTVSDTIETSVNFTAAANVNTLVLTGTSNLQATANAAGDTLVSNSGVDTLVGGAGPDLFVLNNAADVLVNVGAGDTVESSGAYTSLATPGVTFVLTGSAGLAATVSGDRDVLVANDGDDTLTANGTNETLAGGAGNDLFIVNDPSAVVAATAAGGMHSIQSSVSFTLPDNIDVLTLTDTSGAAARGNDDDANVLTAGAGSDTLTGMALSNTLMGGAGTDRINAGPGWNVIHAGSGGTALGATTVYGANDSGGSDVSDVIYGDTGVNVLQGGAGDNTIFGGAGTTNITAIGLNNVVSLGASGTSSQPLIVDLMGGSSASQTTVTGGTGTAVIYGGSGTDVITAGTGPTTINAGFGAETIYGNDGTIATDSGGGQAMLVAGAGTELMTGYGHDTMVAGSGTTTFRSDRNSDITYVVPANLGTVTVQSLSSYTDPYPVPVPSTESLVFGAGVSPNSLSYDLSEDAHFSISLVLKEGAGSIAIAGGADVGTITSVTFTDSGTTESLKQLMNSLGVTSKTFSHWWTVGTGDSQVYSTASTGNVLWAFGDNDTVFQSSATGLATAYGDNDALLGYEFAVAGNRDLVTLVAGTDYATIYGQQDTVIAGIGVNSLAIYDASTVVQAAAGGSNQIDATVSFTLPANVQTMIMDSTVGGLVGSSNDQGGQLTAAGHGDTLRGGAGADTLSAQGTNDVLIGGSGAETYVINDASDVIQFGTGAASLNSVQSRSSFTLTGGANTLVETGNYAVGTGNGANDTLTATGTGDTLVAGSGNSTLIQNGTGPAVLVGGAGNDTFVVNNQSDVVQDSATTTNSTIQSSVSFTLPANVNTLLLTQGGDRTGTANSGNDWLSSSGMSDTLVAGSGTDTLVGGTSMTTFVFNAGFGHDQVLNVQNGDVLEFGPGINRSDLTFSAVLGAAGTAPSLVVTSTSGGAVTLQGGLVPGAISSIVFGDGTTSSIPDLLAPSGHSTLAGALGNVIISSSNNDVLVGGSGQDTILAWGSNDTLSAGSSGALIYSAGALSSLTGSAGADTLTALGAGSTLVGGTGSEVFSVSDPTTVISLATPNGNDTILSSANYVLPANVAILTLTGAADLQVTGNSLADTLTANSGNDTLTAGTGLATLIGGAGHDVFVVNNSADVIQVPFAKPYDSIQSSVSYTLPGGVGNLTLTSDWTEGTTNGQGDVITAHGYTNTLTATSGNNWLIDYGQNGTLQAGSGFDTLISFSGSNRMTGGTGITGFESHYGYDTVEITNSSDYFIGSIAVGLQLYTSVDYRFTASIDNNSAFNWTLSGSDNLLADDENPDSPVVISGNAGNDTLMALGSARFVGGTGVDTFIGAGQDTYYVTNVADVIEDSGTQSQVVADVNFTLPSNINTLQLGSSNIVGTANGGNDALSVSNSSHDILVGGAGNDLLTTSTNGNNTLVAGSGRDTLDSEGAGDTFVLNAGFGQVEARAPHSTNPLIEFGSGLSLGAMTASAVFDSKGKAALQVVAGTGSVTLDGALSGTSYQFQVSGGAVMSLPQFLGQVPVSSSTLAGASGNLILNSQASQSFTTGAGSDSLFAAGANDTLTAGTGTQLLGAFGVGSSVVGGSGLDTLQAYGTGDTLTGGTGANLLQAYGDGDVVEGGAAADTMVGADGVNLTFVVNNASDVVQTTYLAGMDTICSSANYQLSDYVNILALTGSAALQGQGNDGSDTLVSNSGVDTLIGGGGSNLFILNNALDVVSVATVRGVDTIQTSFNDTLVANVATLVLTGPNALVGQGNSLANTLKANDAGDTLVAGTGKATMYGGAGNDLFVVNNTGDVIKSTSGGGNDTISSSVSCTLPSFVNTLVLTSTGVKGTANTGDDTLASSSTGVDTLVGGTGNDLFIINCVGDVVSVGASHGVDTIQTSFNDTLTANVSTLVLTGSTSVAGVGNTLADTIYGNAGSDTLTAGSGLATMISGTGNTKFVINNMNDVVANAYSTNSDTLSSSVTYTLPDKINTLVLTGSGVTGAGNSANDLLTASGTTGAITLQAGAGSDTLVAGNGADVLISGSGVDSLVAGTGADRFALNNAADVVAIGVTHGVDTIQASFNDTLAANAAVLVLAPGSTALMGTGNSLSDTLVANSGNDTLVAGTGVATMNGGTGNDLFILDNTSDKVVVTATNVSDTIQSSVNYTLPANVQYLQLASTTTALTGTGSGTIASMVVGGAAADTLKGGAAIAVLKGGSGAGQVLQATLNRAVMLGGGAADKMSGASTYRDFYGAGVGGDTITSAASQNVVAFNKGDGALVLAPTTGAANVLSLGAGIDTEALTFTKSGNNLVLNDGVAGDSVTFTNWYLSSSNQTTKTLQVIEAASASFNAAGSDALRNKPIEEFNFTALVTDFNTAGSPAGWSLSTKEGADTLASSATAAYGGDLAYYFGLNGNLTGLNLSTAQSTLTNASFATGLQTTDAWGGISGGASTLSVVKGGAKVTTEPVTRQDGTADGRQTIQPIVQGDRSRTDYVSSAALAAVAMPWDFVGPLDMPSSRAAFDKLWTSMHRQLDLEPANMRTLVGAEAEPFGTAVDPVALLAGAGMSHSTTAHDRRITVPANGLRQI